MELSTSIPTPKASPPSDMMLRLTSEPNIRKKVATTERGIDRLMMAVLLRSRRKRKSTMTARIPPMMAVFSTSSTACWIKVAWLKTTSMPLSWSSVAFSARNSSKRSWTAALTWTVLASPSLKTETSTPSRPLMRVTRSRSRWPRKTRPTSLSLIGARSIWPTTISPISSMPWNSLRVRTRNSASPSLSIPPVRLTFSAARRLVTWLMEMPR